MTNKKNVDKGHVVSTTDDGKSDTELLLDEQGALLGGTGNETECDASKETEAPVTPDSDGNKTDCDANAPVENAAAFTLTLVRAGSFMGHGKKYVKGVPVPVSREEAEYLSGTGLFD